MNRRSILTLSAAFPGCWPTPGDPAACLDGLGLSSCVKTVRLYK